MAFVGHLCILATLGMGFLLFVAYPRAVTFFSITLFVGFLGSSEGFVGTVTGLVIGAAIGGAAAGAVHGVASVLSSGPRGRGHPGPAESLPQRHERRITRVGRTSVASTEPPPPPRSAGPGISPTQLQQYADEEPEKAVVWRPPKPPKK